MCVCGGGRKGTKTHTSGSEAITPNLLQLEVLGMVQLLLLILLQNNNCQQVISYAQSSLSLKNIQVIRKISSFSLRWIRASRFSFSYFILRWKEETLVDMQEWSSIKKKPWLTCKKNQHRYLHVRGIPLFLEFATLRGHCTNETQKRKYFSNPRLAEKQRKNLRVNFYMRFCRFLWSASNNVHVNEFHNILEVEKDWLPDL